MNLPAFRELPAERRTAQRALVVAYVAGPRRRLRARILVVAALAAAVGGAIALLPGRLADEGRVDVIQRALAVVSEGPVIHAVVQNEDSHATLVDLTSGEETIEHERHEYWYDEQRGEVYGRLTIGREVLNEFHSVERDGPPPSHRALAFATHYRDALESGRARVLRREQVKGRDTIRLRIDVPAWNDPRSGQVVEPAYVEEVSVDAESFKPLRFRHLPGPDVVAGPIEWWQVISIESVDRDEDDFKNVNPIRLRQVAPSNDRKVSPDEAATALGRSALWPGRSVVNAELDRIGVVTTTITWLDGSETKRPSLLIRYGRDLETPSRDWIWMIVGLGAHQDLMRSWGPYDGESVPAGKVRLAFVPSRDDQNIDMWYGNVERDGLYINMTSPRRDLIVAAGKALKPLD